ncbi:hypothetical protein RFI_25287, partial [Reticulomyxa filosa]
MCLVFEYNNNRVSWIPLNPPMSADISTYNWNKEFVEMKQFVIKQFDLNDKYVLFRNAKDKGNTIDSERELKSIWESMLLNRNGLTVFQLVVETMAKQMESENELDNIIKYFENSVQKISQVQVYFPDFSSSYNEACQKLKKRV